MACLNRCVPIHKKTPVKHHRLFLQHNGISLFFLVYEKQRLCNFLTGAVFSPYFTGSVSRVQRLAAFMIGITSP